MFNEVSYNSGLGAAPDELAQLAMNAGCSPEAEMGLQNIFVKGSEIYMTSWNGVSSNITFLIYSTAGVLKSSTVIEPFADSFHGAALTVKTA